MKWEIVRAIPKQSLWIWTVVLGVEEQLPKWGLVQTTYVFIDVKHFSSGRSVNAAGHVSCLWDPD